MGKKCELAVQLDEPDRIYQGGDIVRGVVTVNVESKVKCKKLTIEAGWATHGRGNVDGSTSETATEFPEEWVPGKEYRYPFELTAARWPPTYHGTYLSVDHYINAQAYLAWAFDPKASAPYQVFAADGPDAMEEKPQTGSLVGLIFLAIFLFVFAILILFNPLFWVFGGIIGLLAGGWWFTWRYLPKRMLGEVGFEFARDKFIPGEILEAELSLSPNSKVPINEIRFSVTGAERCVSGHGTNKKTYSKVVFQESVTVMEKGELKAAENLHIPLQLQLPTQPIFSLNLGSNNLTWSCEAHIDIPRWPDWKRSKTFIVYPPSIADAGPADQVLPDQVLPDQVLPKQVLPDQVLPKQVLPKQGVPVANNFEQPVSVSFEETVTMIQASLGDNSTVDELVNAVAGLPMDISVLVEGRVVYEGDDPHGYAKGYSVLAHSYETELPMQMFIRAEQRDHFSHLSRTAWKGTGQIVGYSHHLDRLLVKVD